MMNRWALTLVGVALLATPGFAQKVYVDYDKSVDFSKYNTFTFVETGEDLKDADPLAHDRVVAAIMQELVNAGMKEVESDPDVFVTYHSAEKEETRINTTHMGYGWGGDWYWDGWGMGSGMGSSTSNVINYAVGTLIVDLWDAEGERLVWRGSASATVSSNPRKDEKKINKAVAKMAKEWERMQKRR